MEAERYWDTERERWCRHLYTKEQIINIMKKKAEELGRTPTTNELEGWVYESIRRQHWTIEQAREAAGLQQIIRKKKEYSQEEIIKRIKEKADELGHSP